MLLHLQTATKALVISNITLYVQSYLLCKFCLSEGVSTLYGVINRLQLKSLKMKKFNSFCSVVLESETKVEKKVELRLNR